MGADSAQLPWEEQQSQQDCLEELRKHKELLTPSHKAQNQHTAKGDVNWFCGRYFMSDRFLGVWICFILFSSDQAADSCGLSSLSKFFMAVLVR